MDTIEDFDADDGEKIDLSYLASITGFTDLTTNHLSDVGGVATIDAGGGDTITLTGYQAVNFGAGNPISDDDFIF